YDTRTLQPLRPMYVSSVDSGNLAGLLLTLRPGLLALVDAPILSPRAIDGVHDTLQVLLETAGATPRAAPARRFATRLERVAQMPMTTLGAARRAFAELAAAADECVAAIAATNDEIARSAADTDALRAGSAASQAGARDGDRAAYAHDPDEPSFFDVDRDTEAGPEADVQRVIDEPDEAPLHPHALQRSPAVETLRWARALSRQCHAVLDELYALAPAGIESGRAARSGPADSPNADARDASDADEADSRAVPTLRSAAEAGSAEAADRLARIAALLERIDDFTDIDYEFLYDGQRRLLSIGYNVDERRL